VTVETRENEAMQSTNLMLERRIAHLERTGRVWFGVMLLAVTGCGLTIFLGASFKPVEDKIVTAERFLLRDAKGKYRASMDAMESGQVGLGFFDSTGKRHCWIGFQEATGTAAVIFEDAENKERLSLRVNREGTPILSLQDSRGKAHISLTALPEGNPILTIGDATGTGRLSIGHDNNVGPFIYLKDKDGSSRGAFRIMPDQSAQLLFFDALKKPILGVPPLPFTK
jgi:hypothetical protein